jgi:hypothetical protein
VSAGHYATGCQADGTACTGAIDYSILFSLDHPAGQSACAAAQYYCVDGTRLSVSAGFYATPTADTATMQVQCEVQSFEFLR